MNHKYRFDYYLLLSHPIYKAFAYLGGVVCFGYILLATYHATRYDGFPTIALLIPVFVFLVAPFIKRSLIVDDNGVVIYVRQDLWSKSTSRIDSISIHQEKKYGAFELHRDGQSTLTDIILIMRDIEMEHGIISQALKQK